MNNETCVCWKTVDFVWILMTCSDFPVFEAQLLPVYTILHRFCLYGMFANLGDMEIYTCYWRLELSMLKISRLQPSPNLAGAFPENAESHYHQLLNLNLKPCYSTLTSSTNLRLLLRILIQQWRWSTQASLFHLQTIGSIYWCLSCLSWSTVYFLILRWVKIILASVAVQYICGAYWYVKLLLYLDIFFDFWRVLIENSSEPMVLSMDICSTDMWAYTIQMRRRNRTLWVNHRLVCILNLYSPLLRVSLLSVWVTYHQVPLSSDMSQTFQLLQKGRKSARLWRYSPLHSR